MKLHSLRLKLILRFALIVLAVIAVISISANLLIGHQFEQYVMNQQDLQARELADNLASQYDTQSGGWNLDYVHGMGMYALNEGYILKLYDADETVLWDAENHDMSLCAQIMDDIALRMQSQRPELDGDFTTRRFDLTRNGALIGYLDVGFYSPYYLNENAFQFLSSLNRILLAAGLVSLAGAILMGLLLAAYITKPIAKTVEITRLISEGDYRTRIREEPKARELAGLARAVNQMAENLERQEALRKRLTSDVAHELRTPLANVSSYMEMMIEGVWEPTPERLQSCYDELQRLSGLVSDLERLRQVENGNLSLKKREIDLLALARVAAGQFEGLAAQNGQTLTVEGEHTLCLADRDRIMQVITNLLSNAVSYTGQGGSIRVLVQDSPEAAVLRVQDNGPGIAAQDMPLIFERFYRADKSRSRKNGGAGIGLTIAKAIADAHGGEISVESAEGRGSCFTLKLPKE